MIEEPFFVETNFPLHFLKNRQEAVFSDSAGLIMTHENSPMETTFSDIEDAVYFVSMEPYGTNEAFVSLDTGQTFLLSGNGDSDELPDDFEESNRYLAIPHNVDGGPQNCVRR